MTKRGQSPAPSTTALGSPGPGSASKPSRRRGQGARAQLAVELPEPPQGRPGLCAERGPSRGLCLPRVRGAPAGETGQWGSLHSPQALPSPGCERKTGAISHGSARRSKGSAILWGPPSSLGHWHPARLGSPGPSSPSPLSGYSSFHRKTQGPALAQAPPSPHPVLRKMARRVPASGSSANRHGLLTALLLSTQDRAGGGPSGRARGEGAQVWEQDRTAGHTQPRGSTPLQNPELRPECNTHVDIFLSQTSAPPVGRAAPGHRVTSVSRLLPLPRPTPPISFWEALCQVPDTRAPAHEAMRQALGAGGHRAGTWTQTYPARPWNSASRHRLRQSVLLSELHWTERLGGFCP